jgi:light-regulated signal transduction histidine kinase (bacteriophytochrome)
MNLSIAMTESGARVEHGELPVVRGDDSQIAQLFQNLIGNAIKYRAQQPPRVMINAECSRGEWCFSVRDNGIGIDPRYSTQIFGIFKRLHGSEYPGTGIGLALCKRIVERHGGRLWVESQLGQGDFRFTLPALED